MGEGGGTLLDVGQVGDLTFRPCGFRQTEELTGGFSAGVKNGVAILHVIAQQMDGHIPALLQQGGEHLPFLRGEVGEAGEVEFPSLCPAAVGQPLGQPGEPVSGVGGNPTGEGIVSTVNEGEVL